MVGFHTKAVTLGSVGVRGALRQGIPRSIPSKGLKCSDFSRQKSMGAPVDSDSFMFFVSSKTCGKYEQMGEVSLGTLVTY